MNTVVSNVVHVVTDCQQLSLTQCSIQKKNLIGVFSNVFEDADYKKN